MEDMQTTVSSHLPLTPQQQRQLHPFVEPNQVSGCYKERHHAITTIGLLESQNIYYIGRHSVQPVSHLSHRDANDLVVQGTTGSHIPQPPPVLMEMPKNRYHSAEWLAHSPPPHTHTGWGGEHITSQIFSYTYRHISKVNLCEPAAMPYTLGKVCIRMRSRKDTKACQAKVAQGAGLWRDQPGVRSGCGCASSAFPSLTQQT